MTDDLTRPGSLQLAQASGEATADQDVVVVAQPPDGGEIILPSLPNRRYDLQFDPRLAEVRVVDADGDGDLDMVLMFNAGTNEESRIVFVDMVEAAQSGSAPLLQSGTAYFGADLVIQQAQALAGEQPSLETAAAQGPELVGTGVTQYSDNLGNVIDLLDAQDVIPPVEGAFPSIEPEETLDDLADDGSASGQLVVGSNADDVEGQEAPHRVPNPNEDDSGPILGAVTSDILIGDPGGAIFEDLNVAIILDISGSMVDPANNPAPDVTRLDVVQDALEKILPQLANRGDSVVNLYIQTFSTDADEPLFVGELTTANVDEIIDDIFDLENEAGGFTNYEAPLTDMQDWYLDQVENTDGFSNVAYFLTDGFPNRYLDDDGNVVGTGGGFNPVALIEAVEAIPDVLDQDSGTLSGDDRVLLNAIGMVEGEEDQGGSGVLDLLDNTEVVDDGPPQRGEALIVDLGDPSTVPDGFLVLGFPVGADEISGRSGDDVIFGDVPNSDDLADAEGIDLPPGSGWFVFEALESGQSPSSPGWDRGDTISYLRDPANQPSLIGAGRGEGDTIDGGGGDDTIFGQGGDDIITGGPGADTFLYTLAANEGDDEILDFSTEEGDLLSFVNVTDEDSPGTIGIEDVLDSFIDGGGAGAVDTLVLKSGTTIMLTDVTGLLTDVASVEENSLINGV